MGLLRSEPMKHGTLILPADQARDYVDLLGGQPHVQLEDMNSGDRTFHRPYRRYVQRIDKMESGLRFLRDGIRQLPGWEDEIHGGDVDGFLAHEQEYTLQGIEGELSKVKAEFMLQKENLANLLVQRNSTLEELYVAKLASAFYSPHLATAGLGATSLIRRLSGDRNASSSSSAPTDGEARRKGSGDQFETAAQQRKPAFHDYGIAVGPAEAGYQTWVDAKAGAVARSNQARFEAALFRATRGNVFTHFQEIYEPILDPKTLKQTFKSVFVIYFQSPVGTHSAMRDKIMRVCNACDAHVCTWHSDQPAAEAAKVQLQQQLAEQVNLIEQVRKHMRQEGRRLIERVTYPDGNSLIEEWRLFCAKEKSIYATLDLFEEGKANLRTSCWYPADQEDALRSKMTCFSSLHGRVGGMLVADRQAQRQSPPTYFRSNELTAVIQEMVDLYGVPRYQEANPTFFTIVTFPFLFGIMFGDVGHGLLLFLAGLVLCWNAEALRKVHRELHMARYLVTMMGFFATFAGLLYNDFFAVGLEIFSSRWSPPDLPSQGKMEYRPNYDVMNSGGDGPYPFGIDPAWHGAVNELVFVNSLKMKLSVIVGVVHMTVGIILRWLNAFHEANLIDFFCECIPMMIFMLCFFGFMDAMILYKWVTPMGAQPPSIINSMICMALPMNEDKAPMFGPHLPRYLMLATACSVLVMLVTKPILLQLRDGRRQAARSVGEGVPPDIQSQRSKASSNGETHGPYARLLVDTEHQGEARTISHPGSQKSRGSHGSCGGIEAEPTDEEEEPFDLAEIWMHQVIETIEYTLGTVSHTASYLRLWALSLAHQQLSDVFFEETLGIGLWMSFPLNGIVLYFTFAAWLAVTMVILLGMDVMECSLHTLRLHWVEFNSKFFKADGYPFKPYCHRDVLEQLAD